MSRVNLASFTLLAMFLSYCNHSYAAKINDDDPAKFNNDPLSAQFKVQATIDNGCEFVNQSYDLPLTVSSPVLASSDNLAVTVKCTLGSTVTIKISDGDNSVNNQRRLGNGKGQYINYNLSMSEESSGAGTETLKHSFDNTNPYKFYLKATADITNAQVGIYTDTVTFITTF